MNDVSVSFVLLTYNQEKYVREAVAGALNQTHTPLEVVVSDDCSSDRTFEIVQDVAAQYSGPHRLVLNRNTRNVGLIAHVNLIPTIAKGDLIIVAAGDDISHSDRASTILDRYRLDQSVLLHSGVNCIDKAGDRCNCPDLKPLLMGRHTVQALSTSFALYIGATGAWHRTLFEKFGSIEQRNAFEDLVMGYRAALVGKISFIDQKLVDYRCEGGLSNGGNYSLNLEGLRRTAQLLKVGVAVLRQRLSDTRRIKVSGTTMLVVRMRVLLVGLLAISALLYPFSSASRRRLPP